MIEKTKTLTRIVNVVCILGMVFALFTVCCSIYQMWMFKMIDERVIDVQEKTHELNEGLYQIQSISMMELMSVDEEEKEALSKNFNDLNDRNIEIIEELHSILTNDSEQAILHILYSNYLNYVDKQKLGMKISDGKAEATMQYFVNNVLGSYLVYMNDSIEELHTILYSRVKSQRNQVEKAARSTVVSSIIFAISLVVILIRTARTMILSSRKIHEEYVSEKELHKEQIISMQGKTIKDLAELVESRDGDTGTHIKNTAWYVENITNKMLEKGIHPDIITKDYCERVTQYAPLHDIGKILVSDVILLKPGKLTNDEYEKMKTHAAEGGEIIERILHGIESEENIEIASDIATYHHEKWDGKGYPCGLKGEEIPLCARIMAVADVFDALISKRCYKDAFSVEESYNIINESKGSHFDPEIVDVFLELKPSVEAYLSDAVHNLSPEAVAELIS